MTAEKGRRFRDYDIISVLGRGAHATVYLARQKHPERKVALKVLHPVAGRSEEPKRRFIREIELIAKAHHPNIVRIFEAGQFDDSPYYSMEYLPGETLASKMADGSLSADELLQILRIISQALHYAHGLGIIHRDIKPSNILIDEMGTPFLADFGAARDLFSTEHLTLTATTVGTPYYMSPEQARGEMYEVDARSDIWSLGVILFEGITGRHPFEGETPVEVMNNILEGALSSPRRIDSRLDKDLNTICMKCLARVKARRYASAGDLAQDIRRHLDGEPIAARPRGALERSLDYVRSHPLGVGTTLLVSLLLLASLAFYLNEQRTRQRGRAQIAAIDFDNVFNWILGEKENLFLDLFNLNELVRIPEREGRIDRTVLQRSFTSLGDFFNERDLPLMALRCYLSSLGAGTRSEWSARAATEIAKTLFRLGEFKQAYEAAAFAVQLEGADEGDRETARALMSLLESFWPEETGPMTTDGFQEIRFDLATSGDTDGDGEKEVILALTADGEQYLSFVPVSRFPRLESTSMVPLPEDLSMWTPIALSAGDLDGDGEDEIAIAFSDPEAGNITHIVVLKKRDEHDPPVELIAMDTIASNIQGISVGNTDDDPADEMVIGVIYPERISRVYDLTRKGDRHVLTRNSLTGPEGGPAERSGAGREAYAVESVRGDAGATAIANVTGDDINEVILSTGFPASYEIQMFAFNKEKADYHLLHSVDSGETLGLTTLDLDDDGRQEIVFNAHPPPALFNAYRFADSTAGLYVLEAAEDGTNSLLKPRLLLETSEKLDHILPFGSDGDVHFLVSDRLGSPDSYQYALTGTDETSFLVLNGQRCIKLDLRGYFSRCAVDSGSDDDILITIPRMSSDRLVLWRRTLLPPSGRFDMDHVTVLGHNMSAEIGGTWEECKNWGRDVGKKLRGTHFGRSPLVPRNVLAEYYWYLLTGRDQELPPDLAIETVRQLCRLGQYTEADAFLRYVADEAADRFRLPEGLRGDSIPPERVRDGLVSDLGEIVSFLGEDPRESYSRKDPGPERPFDARIVAYTADPENQRFVENGLRASRAYRGKESGWLSTIRPSPENADEWICLTSVSPLQIRANRLSARGGLIREDGGSKPRLDTNEFVFSRKEKDVQFFILDKALELRSGQGFIMDFDLSLKQLDLGQFATIGVFRIEGSNGDIGRIVAGLSLGAVWNPISPTGFHRTVYETSTKDDWFCIYHEEPFQNLQVDQTYHCAIRYFPEIKRLRTSVLAPDYSFDKSLLHDKEVIDYDPGAYGETNDCHVGVLLFSSPEYCKGNASVGISDLVVRIHE